MKHKTYNKQKTVIKYRTFDAKSLSFVLISSLSYYLLWFIFLDKPVVWLPLLIAPIIMSIYVFVLVCFTTELSLIFRTICLDYKKRTISVNREISFKKNKLQEKVCVKLDEVYKMELDVKSISLNRPERAKNSIRIAKFYTLDDEIKTIIIDYMSYKKRGDLIHRIHAMYPNIYIIGLGYKYTVVQK